MQKDPYLVLGLSQGASQEEVESRYQSLKAKYSEERFMEGEVGMNAARKLSELEQAYNDCLEDIRLSGSTNVFSRVEDEIKAKNYDDAQRILDDIDARDAEWHYYQALVYYKKGWINESKAQIEISIALEPYNEKYTSVLNKMNEHMKGGAQSNAGANAGQTQSQPRQEQRAGYSDNSANSQANANACCDSCCTLMCCDSCCECMGGDLIPCC